MTNTAKQEFHKSTYTTLGQLPRAILHVLHVDLVMGFQRQHSHPFPAAVARPFDQVGQDVTPMHILVVHRERERLALLNL